MTREEAGYLYEIVIERHGKNSNIITSARFPEERQELFPDPILGNSALACPLFLSDKDGRTTH